MAAARPITAAGDPTPYYYCRVYGAPGATRTIRRLVNAIAKIATVKDEFHRPFGRWIFLWLLGRPLTRLRRLWIRFEDGDLLERLYQAVIAAKDLDPATSRTARLFQRGPSKMAKKLAEEAIEVVIDAVNGKTDAVIRESADLLYNLTVLWASAGVTPEDVWREMERREDMLGIAEKLPKLVKASRRLKLRPLQASRYPTPRYPKRRRHLRSGGELSRWKAAHCANGTNSSLIPTFSGMDKTARMMVHAAMLKRTYDWCLDAADKPYALWILAAVAFAESSFFPIPPDIMLLPMSLARPKKAWWFATVCTVASVAGGVLGYAIGALLYDSIGQWLITLYGLSDKVETFRASYAEWGAVIILLKGLTPIPYKLVTITSGFAGYNIWLFVLCSIVARGGRFFIVAVLLNRYGDRSGANWKSGSACGSPSAPSCWCSVSSSRSS